MYGFRKVYSNEITRWYVLRNETRGGNHDGHGWFLQGIDIYMLKITLQKSNRLEFPNNCSIELPAIYRTGSNILSSMIADRNFADLHFGVPWNHYWPAREY